MSRNTLRWITVILPVIFWMTILTFSGLLFGERHSLLEIIFSGVVVTISSTIFSLWIFRYVVKRENEIELRAKQLESLNAASLALTTELEISTVLQKVVDLSRQLVKSRYGALGVLSEDDEYFEQFVSSGVPESQLKFLKRPPGTKGLFHSLVQEGNALRLGKIQDHEKSQGFPLHHPEMTTLLGVPIVSKGRVIGDLYLADKISPEDHAVVMDFDDNDQLILEMFATQAAIAIENAKLYRQSQDLVLLRERERFGMDLHDGIIQSIYAVGLTLEDIQRRVVSEPEKSSGRISETIIGLNEVIRDLRNYILDLRPQRFQGKNLVEGLEEMAKELRANTLISVNLFADDIDPTIFSLQQTVEILHIAQEALTNIRKHARASLVEIRMETEENQAIVRIEDNGREISDLDKEKSKGNGLHNMHERANALEGKVVIEPRSGGGTRVELTLPLNKELIT